MFRYLLFSTFHHYCSTEKERGGVRVREKDRGTGRKRVRERDKDRNIKENEKGRERGGFRERVINKEGGVG